MTKKTTPSEHQEQVAFCRYLEMKAIPFFAIPNGGARNVITAKLLKDEGVKKGVPDLAIFLPKKTIFIEMKRREGGTLSKEQKEWGEFFNSRFDFAWFCCRGAAEAISVIERFLKSTQQ